MQVNPNSLYKARTDALDPKKPKSFQADATLLELQLIMNEENLSSLSITQEQLARFRSCTALDCLEEIPFGLCICNRQSNAIHVECQAHTLEMKKEALEVTEKLQEAFRAKQVLRAFQGLTGSQGQPANMTEVLQNLLAKGPQPVNIPSQIKSQKGRAINSFSALGDY